MSDSFSGLITKVLFPDGLEGLYDVHVKIDKENLFVVQLIGKEAEDGSGFTYYSGDDFIIMVYNDRGATIVRRFGHGHWEDRKKVFPNDVFRTKSFEESRDWVKGMLSYLAL